MFCFFLLLLGVSSCVEIGSNRTIVYLIIRYGVVYRIKKKTWYNFCCHNKFTEYQLASCVISFPGFFYLGVQWIVNKDNKRDIEFCFAETSVRLVPPS